MRGFRGEPSSAPFMKASIVASALCMSGACQKQGPQQRHLSRQKVQTWTVHFHSGSTCLEGFRSLSFAASSLFSARAASSGSVC